MPRGLGATGCRCNLGIPKGATFKAEIAENAGQIVSSKPPSTWQAQPLRGVGNRFGLIFHMWRVSIARACEAIKTL